MGKILNLHRILGFVLSLLFAIVPVAGQAAEWSYTAYPILGQSPNDFLPTSIELNNQKLEALMPKGAGTDKVFVLEQVFATEDLSKWIGVKKQVKLPKSMESQIGIWLPLEKGAVLHLRYNQTITAFFAHGLSQQERFQFERTIRKTRQYVQRPSLFINSAYADEATSVGIRGGAHPKGFGAIPPMTGPQIVDGVVDSAKLGLCIYKKYFQLLGTGAINLAKEAGSAVHSFWQGFDNWRKAPLKPVRDARDAAANQLQELREQVDYIRKNPGLVAADIAIKTNQALVQAQTIYNNVTNPDYIMGKIGEGIENIKQFGQKVKDEMAVASSAFKDLDPDMQSELMCAIGGFALREVAIIGGSAAAAAAITAGTGGTAAGVWAAWAARLGYLGKKMLAIAPLLKRASELYRQSKSARDLFSHIMNPNLGTPMAVTKQLQTFVAQAGNLGDLNRALNQAERVLTPVEKARSELNKNKLRAERIAGHAADQEFVPSADDEAESP